MNGINWFHKQKNRGNPLFSGGKETKARARRPAKRLSTLVRILACDKIEPLAAY